MTPLPKHKMNVDEFLAWSEALPKEAGRFELWDGEVIVKRGAAGSMNAERAKHWRMKGALYRSFYEALRRSGVRGEVAVDGATVRFDQHRAAEPDVVLWFGEPIEGEAIEIPNPAIIIEVLSPSTYKIDLNWKLQAYFTLPSVQHYLIVDPDKPVVIHHHKRGAGDALETRIVTSQALRLDPPGLDVDLTEVLISD